MPADVTTATVFDQPMAQRWARCDACISAPYDLCPGCSSRRTLDTHLAACGDCAGHNHELARHVQGHSALLNLCIDATILSLVEALVRCGLTTTGSCEGVPYLALGRPYVTFGTAADVRTVIVLALEAVEREGDRGREARVLGQTTVGAVERWAVSMTVCQREGGPLLVPHLDLPLRDVNWLTNVLEQQAGERATCKIVAGSV